MNTISNDAVENTLINFKVTPEMIEKVRQYLNEQLAQYNIDCESLHFNKIADLNNPRVTYSQDLWHLGCNTLEWGNVEVHDQSLTGIFTEPSTFADEYRFAPLDIPAAEKLMRALLEEAQTQWKFQAIIS